MSQPPKVTYTPLPSTDHVDGIDTGAHSPPPTYTPASSTTQIESQRPQPTQAQPLITAQAPASILSSKPIKPPKRDIAAAFTLLWFSLYILFSLFMVIHLTGLLDGNPVYLLIWCSFILLPGLIAIIWKQVAWYRLSSSEKERQTRINDLKRLVDKMKHLNGMGAVAAPEMEGRLEREMEILEQLREYPEDEEWIQLVREFESVRVEQAERGWVLRAPAPLPGVRPSRRDDGETPAADGREVVNSFDSA